MTRRWLREASLTVRAAAAWLAIEVGQWRHHWRAKIGLQPTRRRRIR